MPESRRAAVKRAMELAIPASNVVKGKGPGYFIAPRGVTPKGKSIYAALRSEGMDKAKAARIAHTKG